MKRKILPFKNYHKLKYKHLLMSIKNKLYFFSINNIYNYLKIDKVN